MAIAWLFFKQKVCKIHFFQIVLNYCTLHPAITFIFLGFFLGLKMTIFYISALQFDFEETKR